ncbi:putative zinc-binding peptidase [Hymenobacter sp. BT175]|uniref:zinc-binding metallopeptidase family protein n=1 Tax=Hymenobacter translucens TaxID=2886507 RepID=UPI001D0E4AA7|nr:putative zinc-binding peptidase [Hymenobacter translucens]MCC2546346.1 putative zinc-binding peptidase [Hymenobacter translucens]
MKLFTCSHCGQQVYFENDQCEQCRHPLGFEPGQLQLLALHNDGAQVFLPVGEGQDQIRYRYCANHAQQACNWLVPAAEESEFCRACALNSTIPKLDVPEHLTRWQTLEKGKHRLIYSLLRLGLPVVSKAEQPDTGLTFEFLSDEQKPDGEKVMTGHDNGLITINIVEADDIEREMARRAMHEVYRTVLGHFRHEVGHYYWDRLIDNTPWLEECRQLFGDDRQDYSEALKKHYEQGAPSDWQEHFISEYATTHPWEDWAETWAHYLHIIDTLETAHAFGLEIKPKAAADAEPVSADIDVDPYHLATMEAILDQWLPLTFALNSLNRSMGLPDPYPFIISPDVRRKLDFVHRVCKQRG